MTKMQTTIIVGIFTFGLLFTIGRVAVSAEPFVPQVQPQIASSAQKKIVVEMKNTLSSASLLSVSSSLKNATLEGGIPNSKDIVYRVQGDAHQELSAVKANAQVESAYIAASVYALSDVNDTDYSSQWNLTNFQVAGPNQSGWDIVGNSTNAINAATANIKVAVLDTGVDSNHPDLANKVVASVNCLSGSCTQGAVDDHGHGTHVAGIIGAVTDNSLDVASVGRGVKIYSAKVLDLDGIGTTVGLRRGINWAISQHVDVINLSLGVNEGNIDSSEKIAVEQVINDAWNAGIVVVAAAGNCGETDSCPIFFGTNPTPTGYETNPNMYPAAFTNVLSVAALTRGNTRASYSEHNGGGVNWVDVAAPGGQCCEGYAQNSCPDTEKANCVLSLYPQSQRAWMYGTSQASPHIAGVAALILAKNPSLSNTQVRAIIENAGNASWGGSASTHGGINALTALQTVPTTNPNATATPSPTNSPNATATPTTAPPTNTPTPLPTMTPYPTTGVPKLLKTPPVPYPGGPYCPAPDTNCSMRERGDADCNEVVDNTDYSVWKMEYDSFVDPSMQSNANFSCVEGNSSTYWVDLSDFEIWRRNRVVPTGPVPTVTPTPGGSNPTATPTPTPTISGGSTPTPTPTVYPGLISYWKMDDESGPDVSDEETVNNGTAIGTSIVGGKVGTARKFDGVDDKIVVGSNDSIDNLATLSICAWIYPASYGENEKGRIYAKGAKMWFSLEDDNISADKTFRFGVNYSGADLRVSGANNLISLNEWQYACVTWDGSANPTGVKFYKNGTEAPPHRERSTGVGSRVDDSGANGIIGNSPGGNATFKGRIDEMRLYRKVLSAGEVQSLFASYQ